MKTIWETVSRMGKTFCGLLSGETSPAGSSESRKEAPKPPDAKDLFKKLVDELLRVVTKQGDDVFETMAARLEALAFLWALAVLKSSGEPHEKRVLRVATLSLTALTPEGVRFPEFFPERLAAYRTVSSGQYAAVLTTLCRYADMYGHAGAVEYGYPAVLSAPHDVYAVRRMRPKVEAWLPHADGAASRIIAAALSFESAYSAE